MHHSQGKDGNERRRNKRRPFRTVYPPGKVGKMVNINFADSLRTLFEDVACIGALPGGGVTRLGYTGDEDKMHGFSEKRPAKELFMSGRMRPETVMHPTVPKRQRDISLSVLILIR